MFGDLFSQHSDYQKGILYQGRRRFLVPKGKNALEPPLEFKTKRQSRRSNAAAAISSDKLQPLEVAPQLVNVIMNTKNSFLSLRNGEFKAKRNVKSGALKPIVINHFSSVDSKDWEEQYQAGCHLYVNKNTGEVSAECPWKATFHQTVKSQKNAPSSPSPNKVVLAPITPIRSSTKVFSPSNTLLGSGSSVGSISSGMYRVYDDAEDLGTGSLVYDRSELDDMLNLLDSTAKASPKKDGDETPLK